MGAPLLVVVVAIGGRRRALRPLSPKRRSARLRAGEASPLGEPISLVAAEGVCVRVMPIAYHAGVTSIYTLETYWAGVGIYSLR